MSNGLPGAPKSPKWNGEDIFMSLVHVSASGEMNYALVSPRPNDITKPPLANAVSMFPPRKLLNAPAYPHALLLVSQQETTALPGAVVEEAKLAEVSISGNVPKGPTAILYPHLLFRGLGHVWHRSKLWGVVQHRLQIFAQLTNKQPLVVSRVI